MRRFIFTAVMVCLAAHLNAQVPDLMSYQAVIRNSNDQLVVNTQVGLRISIQKYVFGAPPSYENVYVEIHTPVTNENGLISIKIGEGSVVGGNLSTIDWAGGAYYIQTQCDPTGGTNYSITGRNQLLSVPYALNAKNAKNYKIGDFAHGGIVFWVDETGQHGKVCAKSDLSIYPRWHAGTSVRTATYSNSGKVNTAQIIAVQTAVSDDGDIYAARACNELELTENSIVYNEWYLPSLEELGQIYANRTVINQTAVLNGGTAFVNGDYWSSNEFGSYYFARTRNMVNGTTTYQSKDYGYRVRPVRSF